MDRHTDSKPFIYLASQSPRRAQLLDQIGVAYQLLLADSSEDAESLEALITGETPRVYVERVTQLKLEAAMTRLAKRFQNNPQEFVLAPVLCADTTVALGGKILGKPSSSEDAVHMLTQLSGQTHEVLTAVALGWTSSPALSGEQIANAPFDSNSHNNSNSNSKTLSKTLSALSVSTVEFAKLTRDEIERYVDSGEPMGKAGSYGVQGKAAGFIKNIQGSYSGIMGLPLYECSQLLAQVERLRGVAQSASH